MRNPKADILDGLLAEYPIVQVWLHSRTHADTELPTHLRNKDCVMLELGLNMVVPIPDLRIGDGGFVATLSFNRQPFRCVVLWDAVFLFSIRGEGGVVFDAARCAAAGIELEEEGEPVPKPAAARRALPAGWAVIEGGRGAPEPRGAA